jgi:hypothetical protein
MKVMGDAAARMFEVANRSSRATQRQHDTMTESALREIGTEHGVPVFQLEDITMHSLLQPAGRDPVSRERLVRFAHRSFQEWYLARHFARKDSFDIELPRTATRFLGSMRADLEAGGALLKRFHRLQRDLRLRLRAKTQLRNRRRRDDLGSNEVQRHGTTTLFAALIWRRRYSSAPSLLFSALKARIRQKWCCQIPCSNAIQKQCNAFARGLIVTLSL